MREVDLKITFNQQQRAEERDVNPSNTLPPFIHLKRHSMQMHYK